MKTNAQQLPTMIELGKTQKMIEWLATKLYLDTNSAKARSRTVKRGEVYECNFGCGIGSEMQKKRPAIIIQNDVGDNNSGNTIVVPITHSNSTLSCIANIITQTASNGDTIIDGQANASNMMCVSKSRIGKYICKLSSKDMKEVDIAIARTLSLMSYYSDINNKLGDKLSYIERIKKQRNDAQDELKLLKENNSSTD